MDTVIDIFLPLSLAFIMFTLGLGLVLDDFRQVFQQPVGFILGAGGQLIVLPIVALILIWLFGLAKLESETYAKGALAVGFMILALSPGGVTSNLLTKLAKGDVALSVSLTAIISLVVVITVPLLLGPIMRAYMGAAAPEFSIVSTALSMFLIVAVPVGIGVAVRRFAADFALGSHSLMSTIATVLFVIIVVGALAASWDVFIENLARLGPALIALNILMLLIGYGLARGEKLSGPVATSISIETGIQNATIGVTVGGLIAGQATGDETFSAFAIASGVYGITMYLVSLPFVFWRRSQNG